LKSASLSDEHPAFCASSENDGWAQQTFGWACYPGAARTKTIEPTISLND
jgi:hypothetical protein